MNLVTLQTLYERHAPKAASAGALLLALLAGSLVAQIGWALVPPPDTGWQPVPRAKTDASSAESGPGFDLEQLVRAELFGSYSKENEEPETSIEDAPETRLSLKLLGVYAADESSMSRAIIASAREDAKIYAIGDTISRNVTLHSVFTDRVVISREGALETLRMERDELDEKSAARSEPASTADSGNLTARDPQQLADIRNELLQNPGNVTNYIRVVPASSSGQQRGYRIYPGRERALFEAAGMRPGDLVTAVNGVSLDSPQRAMSLLNDLRNAQSINVTVERGGNEQNYTLSIN